MKCKVRISITKEQLENYGNTAEAGPDTPSDRATPPPDPIPSAPAEPVAAPDPPSSLPTPEPSTEARPALPEQPVTAVTQTALAPSMFSSHTEMALHQAFLGNGESDLIVATLLESEINTPSHAAPAAAGNQVAFTCPNCQKSYPLRRNLAGKKVRCRDCFRIVRVDPASPVIPNAPSSADSSNAPSASSPPELQADTGPEQPAENAPATITDPESNQAPEPPTADPITQSSISAPQTTSHDDLERLRREVAEARETAFAAEEILNQFSREKIKNDLALLRKAREAETQARDLAGKLKEKDDEFQSALSKKENQIRSLACQTADLETRLRELSAGLEAKEKEMRTALSKKDEDVDELLQDLQALEPQVKELTASLTAKNQELLAVTAKMSGFEKQVSGLTAQFKDKTQEWEITAAKKDAEAENLLKQVLDLEANAERQASQLKSKEEEFRSTLAQKDAAVQSLSKKVQEQEAQAADLAVTLKTMNEKMDALAVKEDQLKSLSATIESSLTKQIDAHQLFLASLRGNVTAGG
ncbi:MAG: hypothetical protein R6X19_08110 [Kiritimatiellia bacterium]